MAPLGVPRAKGLVPCHPCDILPWTPSPSYPVALKGFETATFTGAVMVVLVGVGQTGICTVSGKAQPKTRHPHSLLRQFHTPTPLNGLCSVFLLSNKKRSEKNHPTDKKRRRTYPSRYVVCGSNPTKQLRIATSPKQPSPHTCAHPAPAPFNGTVAPKVLNFSQCVGGQQSSSPLLPC